MHNEPFRSAPCWQTDEWQDQEDFLMTMSARKIDDLLASICLHCGNKSMRPSGARGLLDRAMELVCFRRVRCRGCLRRAYRFCPPWNRTWEVEMQQPSRYVARKARRAAA